MRRISLRSRILLYLAVLHAALVVLAWLALRERTGWFLAAEAALGASLIGGIVLVRAFFAPIGMIRTASQLMREEEFSARFRETGHAELDDLVRIYNRMVDRLREERLRAEESRGFVEKVLAASPAAVLTLDLDGRIASLNPAAERLFHLPSEQLLGRTPEATGHPLAGALGAIAPGSSEVLTWQGRRRVKATHASFYDRGFTRAFFVLEELTDELRASEKAAYEKLIRMITHEINNSVGAVRSLLESLRHYEAQIGPGDREDFAGAVRVATDRLNHLDAFIRGFADVVRLPAPERRPCDVRALVDDLRVLLRPELEARRITCTWTHADPVPPVLLDKNQIEQVLVNVLRNAMESIGEDGTIDLRLVRDAQGQTLTVTDSGGGIPLALQGQIFTPFFSTKRDGRGLGLTVIQEILAAHRFDFALEPGTERGASFRIVFGDEVRSA